MYIQFYVGFIFGVLSILALLKVREVVNKEDKKEIDCWVNKPVIREEHFNSISVMVSEYVPLDKYMSFSEEYAKHCIEGKLKLKLIDKIWEFVKVEMIPTPYAFENRYNAELRILVSARDAFKHEMTKQES